MHFLAASPPVAFSTTVTLPNLPHHLSYTLAVRHAPLRTTLRPRRPRHPPIQIPTSSASDAPMPSSSSPQSPSFPDATDETITSPSTPQPPPPSPSLNRQLLSLAFPALGALALDPLLSLIDTAFVGRLGVAPIAAVSLATLLLNTSFSLFNFLCIAITPLVANALHQNPDNPSAPSRPIATALHLAFFLGTLTATALTFFSRPLVLALGATPDALPLTLIYLRARAIALPFALMTFVFNGALRALCDLRTPFVVALIANATNVSLDLLLIFRLRLGVLGAAVATSIAQLLAFVLMLANLVARKRLRLKDLTRLSSFAQMRPMLSAGIMFAVRTCSLLSTVAYATATAATRGVTALAAFELCRQLWVFNATLLDSLAAAAQALVATAMASGTVRRARNIATRAITLSVIAATALATPALMGAGRLPGLFTRSAAVRTSSAACIRVAALCAPVNGAVFALDGILAACADYQYLAGAIAVAAAAACVAITVVRVAGGSVAMVWAGLNVLMIARAVVLSARFYGPNGPMAVPGRSSEKLMR